MNLVGDRATTFVPWWSPTMTWPLFGGLPGHFVFLGNGGGIVVHERDSRRRQIVDALAASGDVTAVAFYGKGREAAIRGEGLRRMVKQLLDRNVTRLIIESREGRDHLDRQVLLGELRRHPAGLGYDHMPAHSDPLLWVADAVAWCSSAGGVWRDRIEPLVVYSQNVTRP